MHLLDYRMSTAVWVGIIALVGLAAQTGIVMIVYIDQAYERRKQAGLVRDLNDIIWAHMEGTVKRVRPKLMTVSTMLVGLVPLLWATSSGADVMKRIAAPGIGHGRELTERMLSDFREFLPLVTQVQMQLEFPMLSRRIGSNEAPKMHPTTHAGCGLTLAATSPD